MHRKLLAGAGTVIAGMAGGIDALREIWSVAMPLLESAGFNVYSLTEADGWKVLTGLMLLIMAYTKDDKRDQSKAIDAEALARAVKEVLENEREIVLTERVPDRRTPYDRG
jgi:hypothetical protein